MRLEALSNMFLAMQEGDCCHDVSVVPTGQKASGSVRMCNMNRSLPHVVAAVCDCMVPPPVFELCTCLTMRSESQPL